MSGPAKRYLVCYDIAHPKRLRKVAKTMESFGTRIQYSVFECSLDDLRLEKAKAALKPILNQDYDQVLFVSLGSQTKDSNLIIDAIGLNYTVRSRVTIV